MYFTDISNEELQYFRNLNVPNFSISLTQMLSSDLFKIESIIPNIYRIYPLFYTSKITSNNLEDVILENKCILATKQTKETYFIFISNPNEVIVAYDDTLDYYAIDDDLTNSQFNSMIQLFRSKNNFTENIDINNSNIAGEYGTYVFNLESTTIVDDGVLITNETLENIGTVRLVNPVFKHSNYVLKLKVYSIDDVNVDLSNANNITITPLNIILEENTDVLIPFETLDLNNVVSFDAEVIITHNKNFIQYPRHLSLGVVGSSYTNQQLTLTAEFSSDESGVVLEGENISFYDGDTLLGSSETDEEGIAVFTYTPLVAKEYQFQARIGDVDSNVVVMDIDKQETSLVLTSNKSVAYIPTTFVLTGVLTNEITGAKIYSANVKLYNGNTLIDNLTTDNNGRFTKTISVDSDASYQLKAIYDGSDVIAGSESSYVNVTARKINSSISINTNRSTVYYSQNVTISGVLSDELGNMNGATVKLYNGSSLVATTTTNSNGAYSFTRNWSIGFYQFKVVYEGSTTHTSVTSATKNVTMSKAPTSINATISGSFDAGDTIPIKVNSSYGSFNPASVTVKLYNYNQRPQPGSWIDIPIATFNLTEKDANGYFNFTVPSYQNNNYDIVISYAGDSNYAASSKESSIYIVEANVATITASKSGNSLIANFKDSNGNNLANAHLSTITYWVTPSGGQTMQLNVENVILDANGNAQLTNSSGWGTGRFYVTYNNVTSNTINF